MYARYEKIICVSEAVQLHLSNFVGRQIETKCISIPNGVNLEKFRRPFRHIDTQYPVVVTMVAAFRKQKDHPTLLKAFASLPDNYRLKLVGEGETEHEIKRLSYQLGIMDRTEFLGFSDDIPSVLAESDILVLSSNYEGMSLSCIECLSSGRPLIASDVPGLKEVVNGAGLLFRRGDHLDLSKNIAALAENPSMYKLVAERCQKRARDFDIQSTLQGYIKVYDQLASDV